MSVEVTRLPSGLSVVTDRMPHLETASLGVWVGAGSRDEKPDEHGISHLLEHMAFKGTKRRTARQIAEEIEAVGGDLNAATSVESTAYYARVLKADVPLALDVLSDILSEPTFDPEELRARAERHRAGDRRDRRRARRSGVRPPAGDRVSRRSRSAAPFSARRRPCARSIRRVCAPISRATTARPTWWWRRPAPSTTRPSSPRPKSASRASPDRRRRRRSRRISAAARGSRPAISSRCISRWRCKACRARRPALQPAGVHQRARRRHVVAAVPGSAREARALLFDPRLPHALCRHRPVRALCRHRRGRRAGTDARGDRPDRATPPRPSTRPRSPAPRRR